MSAVASAASWRPATDHASRRRRAELLRFIREFFHARGVLEVETPMLSGAAVSDLHIESVAARLGSGAERWLRTSPEFPMKRLLAADPQPIYELGRVFRDDELGAFHQPEFTLLEWYRPGWDHLQLADEVVDLVRTAPGGSRVRQVRHIAYWDLLRSAGVDAGMSDAEVAAVAQAAGSPGALARDAALDYLMACRIAPALPADQLTVVHSYPATQAALARLDPADRSVAQRFEVLWGQLELANGYHELTDGAEQATRMQREQAERARLGLACRPLDERLLAALDAGLAPCAGVALGVDRLLMRLSDATHIDDVINFPWTRA